MEKREEKRSLPFFGIPKVVPFLSGYKRMMFVMVFCGLMSTCVDLLVPQFQRYALDNYIKTGTMDTLPLFIILYLAVVVLTGVLN